MEYTIYLQKTCAACPEEYYASVNGEHVGYLRLRNGAFTVECPHADDELVYCNECIGDGSFDESERERELNNAKEAICGWLDGRENKAKKAGNFVEIKNLGFKLPNERLAACLVTAINECINKAAEQSRINAMAECLDACRGVEIEGVDARDSSGDDTEGHASWSMYASAAEACGEAIGAIKTKE